MTYEVRDVDLLESTTSDLATTNRNINKNSESMQYILDQIKNNWQNDEGQDILSVVSELEKCISIINTAIVPVVNRYVNTMNDLVVETRANQSKTM